MKPGGAVLRRGEWMVDPVPRASAERLVRAFHYSGGGANTAVFCHGLMRRDDPLRVRGVAWWMPPTRVAAETVHPEWQRVLALTRLVLDPDVPTNGASFLMRRSVRLIAREGGWLALVTYADESQGHKGTIYRAAGWRYVGRTGPYPRWVDGSGRQVARKATVSRTKAAMEALGYSEAGSYFKHKFVINLPGGRARPSQPALWTEEAA